MIKQSAISKNKKALFFLLVQIVIGLFLSSSITFSVEHLDDEHTVIECQSDLTATSWADARELGYCGIFEYPTERNIIFTPRILGIAGSSFLFLCAEGGLLFFVFKRKKKGSVTIITEPLTTTVNTKSNQTIK